MTPAWRRYTRFWGARVDDDVDEELAFHVEMRVRDHIAAGMSENDARDAAERRFGNRGLIRNTCLTIGHRRQRHMKRAQTIDAFVQDVRYGVRTLARQKGWTVVALLTISLGIGASTAMFGTLNSVILNPLPYRDADRVAMVWRTTSGSTVSLVPEPAMLEAWKAQTRVFDGLEKFSATQMTLTGRGDAVEIGAAQIEAEFPAFTGINLVRGRTFLPEEMLPGGARVALISEALWRERYGGSPDVLGQQVILNDKPYSIVGIAPTRLRLPMLGGNETGVWLPLVRDATSSRSPVIARIRAGITFDAATKELNAVVQRNQLDQATGPKEFKVALVRAADLIRYKSSLFLLSGAVGLLLLVACANVAHLLLARGATRERELAIRAALGAGRLRLARQLLTESSILACLGCVGGIAVGYTGVRALAALRPDSLSELSRTQIDGWTVTAAVVISLLAGIVFGGTAALHALRRTSPDALRASASSSASRGHTLRSLLVVSEMALSALLLVGSALLVRSVIKLQSVDVGFDTRNLYSMVLSLPSDRYPGAERRAFIDRVVDASRHLPGVVAATSAIATPPNMGNIMFSPIEGEGTGIVSAPGLVPINLVSPDFFRVLGIRLEGSTFGPGSMGDDAAIINRGFATKFWPGQSAVGKRFRFKGGNKQKPDDDWKRVVGVADDVPVGAPTGGPAAPYVYQAADPKAGPTRARVAVRVRDGVDPTTALRGIVKSIDPRLAPPPVMTVEKDLAKTVATQRFTMTLLTVFALLAVLLSAVGLYGVISYVVTQRTREIGIRVALGATSRNVAGAIVARGLLLSALGLTIGLVASVWGTALIKSALFGVTGTDAPSYILASVTLLIVSGAACVVPMRRAMRVDPVIAMRGD